MSDKTATLRRRLPEERPQQILDAALAVFGEHGLQGARLDDIAQAAGVAKGTIYLYFPNKEALFQEMIRSVMLARLDDAAALIAGDTSPTVTALFRRYVAEYFAFLCSERFQTVHPLVVGELKRFPELAEFYSREVIQPTRQLVCGILRRGIESGEFRRHDPEVAARILSSMLISHAMWAHRPVFDKLAGRSTQQVLDEILEFFLASIAAPAAPTAR